MKMTDVIWSNLTSTWGFTPTDISLMLQTHLIILVLRHAKMFKSVNLVTTRSGLHVIMGKTTEFQRPCD